MSIFTKHESNDFFTSVALKKSQHYKTLADFCRKHDPELQNAIMKATKREYKKRIEETALRIKDQIKVLEKKYADVKEKHSVIYYLIRKMIYPPFLAN